MATVHREARRGASSGLRYSLQVDLPPLARKPVPDAPAPDTEPATRVSGAHAGLRPDMAKVARPGDEQAALGRESDADIQVSSVLDRRANVAPDRSFESWCADGSTWLSAAHLQIQRDRAFLEPIHMSGSRWIDERSNALGTRQPTGWLDEVLARADTLTDSIKKVPEWPVEFSDGRLTLVLDASRDWARAWVASGTTGLTVAFRTTDFELRYRKDPNAEVAVGLAIAWFLDCTVSLRGTAEHPHFNAPSGAIARTGSTRAGRRYVPTRTFQSDRRAAANGTLRTPRGHRVSGHVRKLSGGVPSEAARSNAPPYVRRALKANETFVRGHQRGREEHAAALRLYLSAHSSLADALATLST
jgi:hypothetical protein